ncbi:MAG: rod shape-determining protein MreD [Anaerolineales bacterium]|nr:rod shape-determining protein MreD [Anaerolineales bacterium]
MSNFDVYFAIPLMALLSIIQATLMSRFPLFGAVPQLLFLVALAWGLHRSPEAGLVWAFTAGFFLDLFSTSPMGLNALAMLVAVLVVTVLQRSLPLNRFVLPIILVLLGTLIYTLLYIMMLRLFGFVTDFSGLNNTPGLLLANVALFLPVYWLLFSLRRVVGVQRLDVGRGGLDN